MLVQLKAVLIHLQMAVLMTSPVGSLDNLKAESKERSVGKDVSRWWTYTQIEERTVDVKHSPKDLLQYILLEKSLCSTNLIMIKSLEQNFFFSKLHITIPIARWATFFFF